MVTLTPAERNLFITSACSEIERSHDLAVGDILAGKIGRAQWEAQFVARLCAAASGIGASWRALLRTAAPGRTLSFTSVFTHQTPLVEWPVGSATPSCELADLLVAVIDESARYGRAMLIQAKQSDTASVKLTGKGEKKQFDLLSGRPTFRFCKAGGPSNIDLSAENPDDSLQYGLNPPDAVLTRASSVAWSQHRWSMADGLNALSATYAVTAKDCLADWMVELLEGSRGWQFKLPQVDWQEFNTGKQGDSWPALVNYLLEETFAIPLGQLAFGGPAPSRGFEEAMYFASGPFPNMFAITQIDAGGPPENQAQMANSRHELETFLEGAFRGGDGGGPEVEEQPEQPQSGPISAIVFQLGFKEEGGER